MRQKPLCSFSAGFAVFDELGSSVAPAEAAISVAMLWQSLGATVWFATATVVNMRAADTMSSAVGTWSGASCGASCCSRVVTLNERQLPSFPCTDKNTFDVM